MEPDLHDREPRDRRRRRRPLVRRGRHDGQQRQDAGAARADAWLRVSGTRAGTGTSADLYRVYVFSDSDCVNVIHRGSIVASPAYVPRTTGSLKLPLTTTDVIKASSENLKDLKKGESEPTQYMFDSAKVSSTESDPEPAKQAATPAAGSGSSSGTPAADDPSNTPPENDPSLPATPKSTGAPVDLWDSGWPNGRFYWTVVPVRYETADPKRTTVAVASAPGASSFRVADVTGFGAAQLLRIGTGATQETLTIVSVDVATNSISTTAAAAYAHGAGEDVQNLTATVDYWDLELPQDVCGPAACMRSARRACRSSPLDPPFVSGLSPKGRLTSAATARPSFYGTPLVAWQPASAPTSTRSSGRRRSIRGGRRARSSPYATSALLTARARQLVLPRPRLSTTRFRQRPPDGVVDAGRR